MRLTNIIAQVRERTSDRAAMFAGLNVSVQGFSLLAVSFIVASKLTLAEQGFYYAFFSLVALQALFELGFGQCIVQFLSHEYANKDEISQGARLHQSRLSAIVQCVFTWYRWVSGGFVLLVGLGGLIFFGTDRQSVDVQWFLPWAALIVATGLSLALQASMVIMEGANEVVWTNRTRFTANLARVVGVMVALLGGCRLYSLFVGTLGGAFVYALAIKYTAHSRINQLRLPVKHGFDWKRELLPMQWRFAVSWISGYVIFMLVNPIIFRVSGAAAAGRFGMTWTLLQGITSLGMIWINTKIPTFGMKIARKEFASLNLIWAKSATLSFATTIIGLAVFEGALYVAARVWSPLALRLLSTPEVTMLGLTSSINTIVLAQAAYLRAHKCEPLMFCSVVSAGATFVVLVSVLPRYGILGLCIGFFGISIFTVVWSTAVFRRFKYNDLLSALTVSLSGGVR